METTRVPEIDDVMLTNTPSFEEFKNACKATGYIECIKEVLEIIPPHMMDLRAQIYSLAINKK